MATVLNWLKTNLFVEDKTTTKERKITPKRLLIHFVAAVLVFVFIYLSYTIVKPLNNKWDTPNGAVAKAYVTLLFFLLIVSYIVLYLKKKTNFEINIAYILACSLLIHLVYMLYTGGKTRQYDTWSSNHNGHYDYAAYLYQNFTLPNHAFTEANVYQFYHPPLAYFIDAVWMRVYEVIGFNATLTADTEALFISCQILATFYTFLIVWYGIKTLRLFNLSRTATYIGAIFIAFFPRLMQFSGQLNNDVLATLLVVCSIYRLFKYKIEGHSYKDILLSALYLGMAMSAKLSAVIVALGFAAYFIYELVLSILKKDGSVPLKHIIIQYVLFLIIVAPIGLWFQLYAHNVYGLPFNFVFRNLNSKLFTGTRDYVLAHDYLSVTYYDANNTGAIYTSGFYNFFFRYISPFYTHDFNSGIYCNAFDNYNILTYAIKSSIFGEFKYWNGEGFGLLAIIGAFFLWFTLLVIGVYFIVKKKMSNNMIFAWAIILSIIIFYLYLQYSMPYGCSMDARYITPILVPLGLVIAVSVDKLDKQTIFNKTLRIILIGSVLTFALSSFGFYAFAI